VAVGVALIMGVLTLGANTTRAGDELIRGLVGRARFALVARSAAGFGERTAEAAGSLRGVKVAVYLMRADVSVAGRHGDATVQLLGVSSNASELGGSRVGRWSEEVGLQEGGLGLPAALAHRIGVGIGDRVGVLGAEQAQYVAVRAILRGGPARALENSPVALATLATAQRLSGRSGAVSDVLIEPEAGAERTVESELRSFAGASLDVERADYEASLLHQAARPSEQAASLFAAIGAFVGLLLTFNAALLTMSTRRGLVANLTRDGYSQGQLLAIVCGQALVLGLLASVLGAIVGEVLGREVLHAPTASLGVGFPLGAHAIVDARVAALALMAGMGMSLLSSLPPVLAAIRGEHRTSTQQRTARHERRAGAARKKPARSWRAGQLALLGGLVPLGTATVAMALAPQTTVVGVTAIGVAALCTLPLALKGAILALEWLSGHVRWSAPVMGTNELREAGTRVTAVSAMVALTAYGAIALSGVREDVTKGTVTGVGQYFGTAPLWVAPRDAVLNTESFPGAGVAARLRQLRQVAAVRQDAGGLLDVGDRRLLIDARSPASSTLIPPGQLVRGNLARANELLRTGDWATISLGLASAWHLGVGDVFSLPTPTGRWRLRVAAITDLGWSPGAVTVAADAYARHWLSSDPTALEVVLRPHVTLTQGRRAVALALHDRPGLAVRTATERAARNDSDLRADVSGLSEISTLLLAVNAVAVALALGAALWERRTRLSSLTIQGYGLGQLWRGLLLECTATVAVGGAVGAGGGIYAHWWATRFARTIAGLPAYFAWDGQDVALALGLLGGAVLTGMATVGWSAARAPAELALEE
jgi:putative ABC transport system permease protein